MASFGSHGCPLIPGKEQIQTRAIRYPNTRVRIFKHVCLEINLQNNAVLEQMFINFQDYHNHPLQLTLQRTRRRTTTRLISHFLDELCKPEV